MNYEWEVGIRLGGRFGQNYCTAEGHESTSPNWAVGSDTIIVPDEEKR